MRALVLAIVLAVLATGTALMLAGTGTGVAIFGIGTLGVMFTALSAPVEVETARAS